MKKLLFIFLALLIVIPLAGCARNIDLKPVTTRDYNFKNFSGIEADSKTRDFLVFGNTLIVPIDLVVTKSDSYKVSLSANENIFDDIQLSQSGDILKITVDNKKIGNRNAVIKAEIGLPELKSLKINRSEMQATIFSSAGQIITEVTGDSRLNIDLQSGPAVFKIGAASDVTVRGTVSSLTAAISGSSKFNCNLKASAQTFDINSASDVILRGNAQSLEADVSGSSSLDLDQQLVTADLKFSSASDGTGKINGGNINIELSGSSRVDFSGSADEAVLKASGASKLALSDMQLGAAAVTMSGASDAKLQVRDRMDIDLSSSSDLRYHGSPSMSQIKVSGDSRIEAY